MCSGVSDLGEAEVQDVGVEFAQCSGEPIAAQVLTAELTRGETAFLRPRYRQTDRWDHQQVVHAPIPNSPVAELLGQVDVQDVRQDGDKLGGVAQGSADGVGRVNVV